jgi:hypothetical protein
MTCSISKPPRGGRGSPGDPHRWARNTNPKDPNAHDGRVNFGNPQRYAVSLSLSLALSTYIYIYIYIYLYRQRERPPPLHFLESRLGRQTIPTENPKGVLAGALCQVRHLEVPDPNRDTGRGGGTASNTRTNPGHDQVGHTYMSSKQRPKMTHPMNIGYDYKVPTLNAQAPIAIECIAHFQDACANTHRSSPRCSLPVAQ